MVTGDSHRPRRSECAINAAIEVLGDPWSMLVLRYDVVGVGSEATDLGDGLDVDVHALAAHWAMSTNRL